MGNWAGVRNNVRTDGRDNVRGVNVATCEWRMNEINRKKGVLVENRFFSLFAGFLFLHCKWSRVYGRDNSLS